MLRRQQQARAQLQKLVDAILFGISFWLAYLVRANSELEVFGGPREIESTFAAYSWLLVLIVPVAPFLLELQGFYNRPIIASRRRTAWQLFKACLLMLTVLVLVLYLRKDYKARAVLVIFPFFCLVLVMLKEELVRRWMEAQFGKENTKRRFIVVGTKEEANRLKSHLGKSASDGVEICAQLDLNDSSVEHLVDLMHKFSVNGVILTAKHTYFGQIEKAIQACELEGVEAWLAADFFNTQLSRTTLDEFHGHPMLVFRSTPEDSWQGIAKQVVDLAGGFVLLVLALPFFIIVPIAIRLTSPGPIFFRQQRSGLNGRPFTMLKFRSMISNAEQRKQELAILNEMSGPVFKVTNDPRITPVGRLLRKYSIDELPQLLNILRGEMSLVGPRPLPVDEVLRFDDLAHRRRLSVKPGLTCLWQVSGRNQVKDFRDWVRLDLEYIDNWSIWLDFKILIRTVPVVLMGTGAK